jgi:hypothetical protein
MTLKKVRPELFPTIAQNQRPKGQDSLAAIDGPSHSRFLHPSTYQVLAGGFHNPASYRQFFLQ